MRKCISVSASITGIGKLVFVSIIDRRRRREREKCVIEEWEYRGGYIQYFLLPSTIRRSQPLRIVSTVPLLCRWWLTLRPIIQFFTSELCWTIRRKPSGSERMALARTSTESESVWVDTSEVATKWGFVTPCSGKAIRSTHPSIFHSFYNPYFLRLLYLA